MSSAIAAGVARFDVEACAARKVETETKYLGAAALRDWREFYGARGIDLATKEDVRKVKARCLSNSPLTVFRVSMQGVARFEGSAVKKS